MQVASRSRTGMVITGFVAGLLATGTTQARVIDFEDLSLPGADSAVDEVFTSNGAQFPGETVFSCCWQGWIYSNSTLNQDLTVDPGLVPNSDPTQLAQRSTAYIPPSGPPLNYAVASFVDSEVNQITGRTAFQTPILLPPGETVESIMVANTTWAANNIVNGDSFSGPFGPNDEFRLSIIGERQGSEIGTVEFVLAAAGDLVDQWTQVSLTTLHGADTLRFSLASTDTVVIGTTEFLNTPTFFAIDDIVTVSIADFDGSGSVSGNDFLHWQRGFGTLSGALRSDGDADGDGNVDGDDLGHWSSQFGVNSPGNIAAVPESSSLLMLVLAFIAQLFRRPNGPRQAEREA